MNVEIISYTQDPLNTIAKAASVCYRSEPSLAIVKQCINSAHLSVLEHASFTFMISGVDRNLTHQLVRHRIASYSQESQRYCSYGEQKIKKLPKGNGIKYNEHCKFDINQEEFLYEQYLQGFSMKELGKMYDIHESTLSRMFKRNNKEVRTISESKKINENFFEIIDSHDKAYILGFIYADGCISVTDDGKKALIIDQLACESLLMKNILDHLKDNGKLIKSGHDDICRVYIQNNKLCDDLIKYGIIPNKGHYANPEYIFKNLDKKFIKDFIRGIFEGDGCLSIGRENPNQISFNITGTYDTCKFIQQYLINELSLNETKISHNINTTYNLTYSGRNQVKKIIEFLYLDSDCNPLLFHSKKMKRIPMIAPIVFEQWRDKFINYIQNLTHCLFPSDIINNCSALYIMANSFYNCYSNYNSLIKELAYNQCFGESANEKARSVLPGACETRIVLTMNLRALAHFMNERLCTRAQEPIRKLANAMKQAVLNLFEKTEEKEIIRKLLVPKCEVGVLHFCPEAKTCNRHKTAKEINSILDSIEKEDE